MNLNKGKNVWFTIWFWLTYQPLWNQPISDVSQGNTMRMFIYIYIYIYIYTHTHTHTCVCVLNQRYRYSLTKPIIKLWLKKINFLFRFSCFLTRECIYSMSECKNCKTGLVVECSPIAQETGVQSQVESYQRLKKWYLIPPCLTLSIIKSVSRVKWRNPGNGVAPSTTSWCSSYWKGST